MKEKVTIYMPIIDDQDKLDQKMYESICEKPFEGRLSHIPTTVNLPSDSPDTQIELRYWSPVTGHFPKDSVTPDEVNVLLIPSTKTFLLLEDDKKAGKQFLSNKDVILLAPSYTIKSISLFLPERKGKNIVGLTDPIRESLLDICQKLPKERIIEIEPAKPNKPAPQVVVVARPIRRPQQAEHPLLGMLLPMMRCMPAHGAIATALAVPTAVFIGVAAKFAAPSLVAGTALTPTAMGLGITATVLLATVIAFTIMATVVQCRKQARIKQARKLYSTQGKYRDKDNLDPVSSSSSSSSESESDQETETEKENCEKKWASVKNFVAEIIQPNKETEDELTTVAP